MGQTGKYTVIEIAALLRPNKLPCWIVGAAVTKHMRLAERFPNCGVSATKSVETLL